MMSKLQRSITGSEYGIYFLYFKKFQLFKKIDHVALILRYGNDDLVLLESTGKLVIRIFHLDFIVFINRELGSVLGIAF